MHSAPNNEVKARGGIMIQRASKETTKSAGRTRSSEVECKFAMDIERVKVASTSHHDPKIRVCSSTGSSVSRKARKHLSVRWQTACQPGSENSIPRHMKTLGEMLELSEREVAKEAFSNKRSSDPMSSHDNSRKVPANPLGISSKDGWKTGISCEEHSRGGISRNFPLSKSLPASLSISSIRLSGRRKSASTCRLPILKDILNTPTDESENARVKKRSPIRNAKQKYGRAIVQVGKENMLSEKEIHVTSENKRHSICISNLPRAVNTYTKYLDDATRSRDQQASEFGAQHERLNSKRHTGYSDGKLTTSFSETEENGLVYYEDIIALKDGRNTSIQIDVAENDTKAIHFAHIASAESCESSSPSTTSQQSSGGYMYYAGIFNSINVGIQGLREQLKMLKTEDQDGTCEYYSDILSDECSSMNTSTYPVMEEHVPLFKDEDRDFSYVQEMLDSACDFPAYLEDWQVSSDVFLWLESKYNKLLLWSKLERKLLFDLVNSVIADMIAPSSHLHSKVMVKCLSEMDHGHFTNYVWKMVQKQRYYDQVAWDCILPLPLDHGSELDLITMEVVNMKHDDIIEESIVEFMSKN